MFTPAEIVPSTTSIAIALVSSPGIAQTSLRTWLESLPAVDSVCVFNGCLTALKKLLERPSSFLVIDANIPQDEVLTLVAEIEDRHIGVRYVALADTSQHERRLRQAGVIQVSRRNDLQQYIDRYM